MTAIAQSIELAAQNVRQLQDLKPMQESSEVHTVESSTPYTLLQKCQSRITLPIASDLLTEW